MMSFAQLETGVGLHYRDCGEGKPLVFFPQVDIWNYQVLDLTDRHRCVLVDLRGTGDSDKPFSDYTFQEWCSDLKALIRHLDLSDVALVGWSMGGGVALQYVLDFNQDQRVSRLVMVGAAAPRFTQSETELFGMDEATAAQALEGARRAWPETLARFGDIALHRTDLQATGEWLMREALKMPAYVVHRMLNTLIALDLRDRLGEIDVPTLVLHGRHDRTCDPRWAEYMADRIDGVKLVWLESSAHYPMVEEPDALSAEIADFVR